MKAMIVMIGDENYVLPNYLQLIRFLPLDLPVRAFTRDLPALSHSLLAFIDVAIAVIERII